jgi:hypothetical protein
VIDMARELQEVSSESRYWEGFDSPTKRKNNTVVTNPRDIVDTGEFVAGIVPNGLNVEFQADHSIFVLQGHRTGESYVPPRDIVTPALERLKQSAKLQNNINNQGE